jgi:hypothetical protein
MSVAVTPMSGAEALDLIASAPDAKDKTIADLREAADDFEALATRKDRILVTDGRGTRAKARMASRQRDGEKLRLQAQITRLAAQEVEDRDCTTVGEAMRPAIIRRLRRVTRRAA